MNTNGFRKKVVLPYQKRKKLLDLNILEKVYNVNRKYLIFGLIIAVLFLLNRKYFVFVLLTLISTVFSLYHSKYNRTPVDLKFALFLGLFITRYYGLLFTVIFFIISDIIPALLGGESIKGPDLVFFVWYFLVNSFVFLFPALSLVKLGPVLVIIHDLGSVFINTYVGGIPFFVSIWVSIIVAVVRIIYFLTLGGILEKLFQLI